MSKLKYIIIDVDGTMTDGGIYYDEHGNEFKKFCTKDAAAYFACKQIGISTVVITGRMCAATKRRMEELKIEYLFQGVGNKESFIKKFMREHGIKKEQLGYIGDDLNDFSSMKLADFVGCPKDACQEVREIANYVSSVPGGHGAVRDIIEHILRERGEWNIAVSKAYGIGT